MNSKELRKIKVVLCKAFIHGKNDTNELLFNNVYLPKLLDEVKQ